MGSCALFTTLLGCCRDLDGLGNISRCIVEVLAKQIKHINRFVTLLLILVLEHDVCVE